jgi:hypothetical protein
VTSRSGPMVTSLSGVYTWDSRNEWLRKLPRLRSAPATIEVRGLRS